MPREAHVDAQVVSSPFQRERNRPMRRYVGVEITNQRNVDHASASELFHLAINDEAHLPGPLVRQ
jgi:hypothetical protein